MLPEAPNPISMDLVNIELGAPASSNNSLNNFNVRSLAGVGAGLNTTISMNDLRGKTRHYIATGGEIVDLGIFRVHIFKTSGTFTVQKITFLSEYDNIEYFLIGGGGRGGRDGGGGGGGQVVTGSIRMRAQGDIGAAPTNNITIGRGGSTGRINGESSSINFGIPLGSTSSQNFIITALGGGAGGSRGPVSFTPSPPDETIENGEEGASGGGGAGGFRNIRINRAVRTGSGGNSSVSSPSSLLKGGNGFNIINSLFLSVDFGGSGGGGGAGGAGAAGSISLGGTGGAGIAIPNFWVGSNEQTIYGAGGVGEGGSPRLEQTGPDNSGQGGSFNRDGGSGIVMIRYRIK